MTSLEAKIAALLVECEKILKPVHSVAQKWVIVSQTQNRREMKLQTIADKKMSLVYSFGRCQDKIRSLTSFDIAKQAFERDEVFLKASELTGNWTQFESVFQHLINSSGKIKKDSVSIDHSQALRSLRSVRNLLAGTHLEYDASARIFGVTLRCKSKFLSLPDGVTLHRLNKHELNDRQPVLQPYFSLGWETGSLAEHPGELRVAVTVPLDHSLKNAFFNAQGNVVGVAGEIFSKILQAILVVSEGRANLGHVELRGGLEFMPQGRPISSIMPPPTNIFLRTGDVKNIEIAYDLVSKGKRGDNTLSRALHRYILGRQRVDLIDKLVDYVVAWEAILLTQEGSPIYQELAYRFALNGASLLSKFTKTDTPHRLYKKMRSAYSTRSSVVHGADDKARDKKLEIGSFKNLNELCNFLEESFRLLVFKLAAMKPHERPYRQAGGWEKLIWREE